MFSSRKPLAIALTVVMLVAILVPAAMAAPEWAHGVNIVSPTKAAPVYIDPFNPALDEFKVKYDLTIVGDQVNDIDVRIRAVDSNGWIVVWEQQLVVASNALHEGVNHMESDWVQPVWNYGWYALEVCVRDADLGADDWPFCDLEQKAVLIDGDDPGVELVKPAKDAWLSGKVLLVGEAWDPEWAEDDPLLRYGGIAATWFDYCVITNIQGDWCGPQDQSWITIATGEPTDGVPDQYEATWDSTRVPDDFAYMRFCAADFVGRVDCDKAKVYVNNRFTVNLRPGWNLISTPLMLDDCEMDDVMHHLIAKNTIEKVYWLEGNTWKKWAPGDDGDFEHGKGYWVKMAAEDDLTFVGAWKNVGPEAPPQYGVSKGWNLIGYTHWGQPTYFADKSVVDYLGLPLAPAVEALWRYDAVHGYYVSMDFADQMVKGAGYWLAVADGGTINP
jgi:hypothetical protein